MTAELQIAVDVGSSQTLVGVELDGVSALVTVPDNASEHEAAAVLDERERELGVRPARERAPAQYCARRRG